MHTSLLPHSLRPAKKFAVYKFITNQAGPMGDRLIQRRVFHVYDIIMMFLKMATGIMTALTRFIMAMVIAIFTLPRMDASPLPGWVERYLLLDMGSQSYHAMIMVHHRHSNPHVLVACRALRDTSDDPPARRRARNRFGLALTLLRNPGLAKHRRPGGRPRPPADDDAAAPAAEEPAPRDGAAELPPLRLSPRDAGSVAT